MPHADEPKQGARRRRWFQFSLRWLLILSVIISLPMGYIGWRVHRGRRIQEVTRLLHQHGYRLRGYGVLSLDWWVSLDLLEHQLMDREQNASSASEEEAENSSLLSVLIGSGQELAPQPPENDLLWLWGWGPRILGESTFAKPTELSDLEGRGDVEAIWTLIAELPELEDLSIAAHGDEMLVSARSVDTLHRLRSLKSLRIEGRVDDRFLNTYQPPTSLRDLALTKVAGGSLEGWRQFFAKSRIDTLALRNPSQPKTMLAAAKSLRFLEGVHLMETTLDDEALQLLFVLEPKGNLMITSSRLPEGDDRAKQRLAALDLYLDDMQFRGSEWKQFREEHWEQLFGNAPEQLVRDQAGVNP